MKKIFLIFLFFATTSWSTDDPPKISIPEDNWLKLTCFGSTTPIQSTVIKPVGISDLADFYFELKNNENIPSVEDLRNAQIEKFSKMTTRCYEVRMKKMDFSTFPSNKVWQDWGTDYQYVGLRVESVSFSPKKCREKSQPCRKSSDCCGGGRKLMCDVLTASCEKREGVSQEKVPQSTN